MDALERFRKEFKGWVQAYNRAKGKNVSSNEILGRVEEKFTEESLRQIGAAFINGWLQNESEPDRRYFIRESDRPGQRGSIWPITHIGGGQIDPWWECFVQLADYSRLRTVAERYGHTTRLEDNLMDITVYAGKKLLLYVENKTHKKDAIRLVARMREYGKQGFNLEDKDKGNDPLRKAKYLVRPGAYPDYIAVTAIGFEQVFKVEYLKDKNRFALHETDLSLTEPLHNRTPEGETGDRSIVDPLALELDRLAGDKIWVSLGTRSTAYNFYGPFLKGDGIFIGVYKDGHIWSDLSAIGDEKTQRLAEELSSLGIEINTSKKWPHWKKNGRNFNLQEEDPSEIASRVVAALFPSSSPDQTNCG